VDSFAGMTKPLVYIETTVPNFYYDFRPDPAIIERRTWTRAWWASAADRYKLLTSEAVVEELERGTSRFVPLRLQLLRNLPALPITSEIIEIAGTYIRNKLMPAGPNGDAYHLALASYYEFDFIVTWNCHHLANPNKRAHIRHINRLLELSVPEIVTPLELLRRTR
jgi:predicted nucleic acid-binding protein